MESNSFLLTNILKDETNEFEKTAIEYFSKIIEIKSKKAEFNSNQIINFEEIQIKLFKYEKIIQSLKENLVRVNEENRKLHMKLQEIQNTNEHNDKYTLQKNDNQEIKTILSIIKGEVHTILNTMLGKVTSSPSEQIQFKNKNNNKIVEQPSIIQGLEHVIQINNIHSSNLYSPLLLTDKRIATCSADKSISVISIDFDKKAYTQDIKKENAHNDAIYDLCELSNKRLVSCSCDNSIKIWEITQNNLILLSTLNKHSKKVYRTINLTNNRFATCSEDKIVKIWSNNSPYQEIASLVHDGSVYNILQLKQQEILVSIDGTNKCLDFWNVSTYQKINSMKGICSYYTNEGLVELSNNLLAVSTMLPTIVIVDPFKYIIVKEIKELNYIPTYSSLCVLNANSLIYVYYGKFLQISITDDYKIIYKTRAENKLEGYGGTISIEEGKYLAIRNVSYGLSIIKPYY